MMRVWIGLVVLGVGSWTGRESLAQDRPNVLMIAIDDLNDWIGCLNGHPQARTPNLDRLAARGVLFRQAHCVAPACNPSRAALFSGRWPWVTGVWSNDSDQRLLRIYPQVRLLSQSLRDAGYVTLGTGKLLHNNAGKDAYDEYYSVEQRWSPLSKESVRYSEAELPTKGTDNPRHVTKDPLGHTVVLPLNRMPSDRRPDRPDGESFDWGPWHVPDQYFGDTQITDWSIERLERPREKPLFLAVGYYRPHIPLWAPARFFDRWQGETPRLPPFLESDLDDLSAVARRWALEPVTAGSHATVVKYNQWHAAVAAYLACIEYVDHEVGRLLDALDRSPIADNTWIVLWSDHGWHLGEKQHWGKWTGWERSTHVPLIVVPPRRQTGRTQVAVGAQCDQPVSLIDVYPTLMDVCRATGPAELDGQSLLPLLEHPDRATDRYVVTAFDPGNIAVRTKQWRYIRYADGSEELYDHRVDPNEWHNLASQPQHASTLERFRQLPEVQAQ